MTPDELAALIDSIPEVAEMSRNRATLLDLLTMRPMGKVPEPGVVVCGWWHNMQPALMFVTSGGVWQFTQGWKKQVYSVDVRQCLGWTPIPTPLTEGGNHGA
jgi:hypothetical protein